MSVLHPGVSDGSTEGLLAVHSLSKRSNLAGYRAGFVAGDPQLIGEFLEVRKHTGLMVPAPAQAAMTAALADDEHVLEQRAVYSARRAALRTAIEAAGFTVVYSEAGLPLGHPRPTVLGDGCRPRRDRDSRRTRRLLRRGRGRMGEDRDHRHR